LLSLLGQDLITQCKGLVSRGAGEASDDGRLLT